MKKIVFLLSVFLGVLCGSILATNVNAQKREEGGRQNKKPEPRKLIIPSGSGTAGGTATEALKVEREPYLGLEPCAKETSNQITELENANGLNDQLEVLVKRVQDQDRWTRACAIYRLGEFGAAAQDALPLIIKLLKDEKDGEVWGNVKDALWKIPPDRNLRIEQRIRLSKDPDAYRRIYGLYSLSFFRPIPGTFEAKDVLNALIAGTEDEDSTVCWMSVMGIRQLGFYNIDTSSAIPALSKVLKGDKINPIVPIRAFVPMGQRAMPAAPLFFDILYNPEKYAGKDEEHNRSYVLYLTAAIVLGQMGESIVPLLDRESDAHPFAVIQVLSNMAGGKTLDLLLKLSENPNAEVRENAISNLLGVTATGALQTFPVLVRLLNDKNEKVSRAALSKIGSIVKHTDDKSPELKQLIRSRVVPKIASMLRLKDNCYVLLTLADLGAEAATTLPAIVKLSKSGSYCAEAALYNFGDIGRKYLDKETLEKLENERKPGGVLGPLDLQNNKAKPIKPESRKAARNTGKQRYLLRANTGVDGGSMRGCDALSSHCRQYLIDYLLGIAKEH